MRPAAVLGLLFLGFGHAALGQGNSAAATARVAWTDQTIRLDGNLDEPAWLTADSVTRFVQRDPDEGQAATEATVVRLLARPDGLYVGVWAYDREPRAIRHAQLRRDADFDSDDSFALLLNPQRDRRGGLIFAVNPNGALFDAEILTFEQSNESWNGVWDARARITPTGWAAEIFIPWQTLRYPREASGAWAANFRRIIRHRNEEVLWRAWRRTEGLRFQEETGTLVGLNGLPRRSLAELRPYTLATGTLAERDYAADGSSTVAADGTARLKVGLDGKLAVSPTLTLDLTTNTDFAQVDVDRQVVNLTRFPLFFPEKRPFFLEASGIFDFGQSERTLVFYSRRIGLAADRSAVPLTAGARLTGRVGRQQLGFLAVRTGGDEDAVDLVARVKRDLFSRGYAGGIFTAQSQPGIPGARLAAGLDGNLPVIVGGQNLVFGAFAAATRDSGAAPPAASAWRILVDFPNDLTDDFFAISRLEPGFDPALGFVRETGVLRHTGRFNVFPRPHRLGLRRLGFQFIEWDVTRLLDGTLSHASYAVTPLSGEFDSGDEFELNLERTEDVPADSFEIFPGHVIPPGRYRWDRAEVVLTSSDGRAVSAELRGSVGDFYDGEGTALGAEIVLRVAPHIVARMELSRERARLSTGRFTAQEAGLRLDVAATARLGGTVFLQWDNESERLGVNARLHWIPSPGSDAYLVWSSNWPTGLPNGLPLRRPLSGGVAGKLVYYFRI